MIEVHGFRAGLIDENRFKSHYQSILVRDTGYEGMCSGDASLSKLVPVRYN
jgi:hypothetical protein